MNPPPIILRLDNQPFHNILSLYTEDIAEIEEKINLALNAGINGFYISEDNPSFDLIINTLSNYPRNSYFLMTAVRNPGYQLQIAKTNCRYYDLILLTPGVLINIQNPEVAKQIIYRNWQRMIKYVKTGISRGIGVEDFYDNMYLTLIRIISTSGLPHPNAVVINVEAVDLAKLVISFGGRVIFKVGTKDEIPNEEDISILILDLILPTLEYPNTYTQAAEYRNRHWNLPESEEILSPEEEI